MCQFVYELLPVRRVHLGIRRLQVITSGPGYNSLSATFSVTSLGHPQHRLGHSKFYPSGSKLDRLWSGRTRHQGR